MNESTNNVRSKEHRAGVNGPGPSRPRSRVARVLLAAAGIPAMLLSCTTMERRAERYITELPAPVDRTELITESDLQELPPVVQRYLRYSGVIGKPRIDSFGFTMEGSIRNGPDADWMPLVSRQYNLLSSPARIYYVRGVGNPMSGVDSFQFGKGRMHIKLFNLITLDDVQGPEMDQSGLVTFLNDLVICPLGYFSVPVQWSELSDTKARLSLTHAGMTVTAVLTFAEDGRILNWETDDRYASVDGKNLPDRWSTPFESHGEVSGLRIPTSGRGIHNYDGRAYDYVLLDRIDNLSWNITGLPPDAQ